MNIREKVISTNILAAFIAVPNLAYAIQFEDVSNQAGMLQPLESWGSAWGDYNGDFLPDLWSSNHRHAPTLYRNNGDGSFTNIIPQVWSANPTTDGHGSAWADFDRDGDQDILEQTGGANPNNPNAINQFYVNNNGMMDEQAAAVGLDYGAHRGRSVLWFDYDNDGQMDVALTGYTNATGAFPSSIFKNESSNFTNVSTDLGFDCPIKSNFSTLADLTGDGVLDLICHAFTFPQKIYDMTTVPFTDITDTIPKTSLVFDSSFADFNGDLQADVLNVRIPNNRSNAAQVDNFEVQARLIEKPGGERGFSFSTSGDLDIDLTSPTLTGNRIFIGEGGLHPNTGSGIARVIMTLSSTNPDHVGISAHNPNTADGMYIGYNETTGKWEVLLAGNNSLWSTFRSVNDVTDLSITGFQPSNGQLPRFFNSSATGYKNETSKAGFNEDILCVSLAAGDFDNDMDMDAYLVCEHSPLNLPNRLYENLGDTNGDGVPEFELVANAGGAEGSSIGAGKNVAMADYNVDGFLDLYVTNGHSGGSIPNGPDQMFRNSGNSNGWIEIDLVGDQSNVHGIGARIVATTADGTKQLREQASGTHSYTQNHQRIHFGLASHSVVDLEITWPNGSVDTYQDIAANNLYRAIEGQEMEVVAITTPPIGFECGKPTINAGEEKAFFVWKECDGGSDEWHLQATSGGDLTGPKYVGTISSDQDFIAVEGYNLESNDAIDFTTDPKQITFKLRMWNAARDGIDFSFPSSANVCLDFSELPLGSQILMGVDKTPISVPFNISAQAACQ